MTSGRLVTTPKLADRLCVFVKAMFSSLLFFLIIQQNVLKSRESYCFSKMGINCEIFSKFLKILESVYNK